MSSYGHIRDLQKKDFSIDTTKDYRPVYVIPDDKKELVKQLKAEAKRPTSFGSRPMKTAKEKPLHGICMKCSD